MKSLISLYTGAGGLDLGLEAAGFKTRVALEMDPEAVQTLRHNRDWSVIETDIHASAGSTDNILKTSSLGEGEADMLCGGPPCQPFSKSGYWHSGDSKRLDDPRAKTLEAYLRVLSGTLPEVFLLENVPGMAFSEKDEGLRFLEREIEALNREKGTRYSFSAKQLNAAEYGIPQVRQRVFIVGHREGKPFEFPLPTHALPPSVSMARQEVSLQGLAYDVPPGKKPAATAWDALANIEEDDDPSLAPRGKWAELLRTIPEGHNYLFHTERGGGLAIFGWRRRYWSMLLKLAKNRPSWTITAQPGPAIGPFHWKSRRLSAMELCALQTFPGDYRIVGDVMSAHRQLGNAVPAAMSEMLGLAIQKQFFGQEAADPSKLKLIPTHKDLVPAAEVPEKVTQQRYLALVGEHSAHPGTGMGPGARSRQSSAAT